jgi:hypothetical protein
LLVTPIGFEPITCPLGGGCSVQLSHGATNNLISFLLIFFNYLVIFFGVMSVKSEDASI